LTVISVEQLTFETLAYILSQTEPWRTTMHC